MDFAPDHCRNFAKHGACRFGKECLYKHAQYDQGKPAAVRVVTFGNKANSAAAAAEDDDGHDGDAQQFVGGPESVLS